jgi:hypothetical protein
MNTTLQSAAVPDATSSLALSEAQTRGTVDALLRAPGTLLASSHPNRVLARLVALVATTMATAGFVMASWSGGIQLFLVPLKLVFGMMFAASICLPSLHVFACLSGVGNDLRTTGLALAMGVGLTGLLLVGFAPITWVFSQATSSAAFVGAVHLIFFVISATIGTGYVKRAMVVDGHRVGWSGLWSLMFIVTVLQLATTMRPLIGPYSGRLFEPRMSFVEHWAASLSQ